MSQIQQFPFISVSGKPYERGLQQTARPPRACA